MGGAGGLAMGLGGAGAGWATKAAAASGRRRQRPWQRGRSVIQPGLRMLGVCGLEDVHASYKGQGDKAGRTAKPARHRKNTVVNMGGAGGS